jgi:uncharacterized membrane protein
MMVMIPMVIPKSDSVVRNLFWRKASNAKLTLSFNNFNTSIVSVGVNILKNVTAKRNAYNIKIIKFKY